MPTPNNPYQVPEPYFSMFPPESLPPTRATKADLSKKGFNDWMIGGMDDWRNGVQ